MKTNPPGNTHNFTSQQNPEQDVDPHRDVVAALTQIILQMSGLVSAINDGSSTDDDKAKYVGWLCSASALCLRAQLEYFDQFVGGRERGSDGLALDTSLPPGSSS